MRIGIVSDVHCQDEPLKVVAQALVDAGVDEIVMAGDAHYEYRFSNEVMEIAHDYRMRYIQGNHEMMLLSTHGARAVSAAHVRRANLERLQQTPTRLRVQVDGKILTICHANPWAPDNRYLYPSDPLLQRCDELDTDYLILGHTHVPMTLRSGRTLVINPGSLAFSREAGSEGSITYAVLDTSTGEARIERIAKLDLDAGVRAVEDESNALRLGLP
jgi:putative phosphoesterase